MSIKETPLQIIGNEGLEPKWIGFEITESVIMTSYDIVSDVMKDLSDKKITFALDDFRAGYANIKALMELPYTFIKFDKSIVQKAPSILSLLCDIMHRIGKYSIAEGVETEEQLALIGEIGIDRVQGFYYSKPLKEEAFLKLIR